MGKGRQRALGKAETVGECKTADPAVERDFLVVEDGHSQEDLRLKRAGEHLVHLCGSMVVFSMGQKETEPIKNPDKSNIVDYAVAVFCSS